MLTAKLTHPTTYIHPHLHPHPQLCGSRALLDCLLPRGARHLLTAKLTHPHTYSHPHPHPTHTFVAAERSLTVCCREVRAICSLPNSHTHTLISTHTFVAAERSLTVCCREVRAICSLPNSQYSVRVRGRHCRRYLKPVSMHLCVYAHGCVRVYV